MKRLRFQQAWMLAALLGAIALSAAPLSAAVTVILVRHAEKAAAPAADPPLTEAGRKRAELLADTLRSSGVTAIYVTEYARTQQTAAPVAAMLHLTPQVIEAKQGNALVQKIQAMKGGVVLVVGHSNTVPDFIKLLGGPAVTIDDSDSASLFVLTLGGSDVSLLRLHYGDVAVRQ